VPLATRQIGVELRVAQTLEGDLADDPPDRDLAGWVHHGDPAVDAVAAPRQQREAGPGARSVLSLGQDAPAAGDRGVGSQNKDAGMAWLHRARLRLRQPHDMGGRHFARRRRLVEIGRVDAVGNDPDLPQQFKPARRRRGEHKDRHRLARRA
jgi:hypothetical protein